MWGAARRRTWAGRAAVHARCETAEGGGGLERLELVGACYDPKNVFGTVGLRAPVDYTVVNGCITVAHGKLTGIDEAKTAENARHVCDRYLGKN